MRQLVYQVCYTRYQISFYLWWIGSLIKYCKVLINIMTRIIWKFSCCSLHLQWCFNLLEKVLIWLKNVTSIKKLPISKVECFLKSNFWPKSNIQKCCLHKTIKFGTLTQLACFIFLLKFIKMLWSYKNCQKMELEGDWTN